MKISIKKIQKIVMNKRLIKAQVELLKPEYSQGYADAINDILTDLWRLID